MIPHVVLCLAYVYTNEKGCRTTFRDQSSILLCSGVANLAIPLVKLQVWLFHKWYRYTTARQYRALITNLVRHPFSLVHKT